MSANERRPAGAASEVQATDSIVACQAADTPPPAIVSRPIFNLLDLHAAWLDGIEFGRAEWVEVEVDDRVHAALHSHAMDVLGMSRRAAMAKGPEWCALVLEDDDLEAES